MRHKKHKHFHHKKRKGHSLKKTIGHIFGNAVWAVLSAAIAAFLIVLIVEKNLQPSVLVKKQVAQQGSVISVFLDDAKLAKKAQCSFRGKPYQFFADNSGYARALVPIDMSAPTGFSAVAVIIDGKYYDIFDIFIEPLVRKTAIFKLSKKMAKLRSENYSANSLIFPSKKQVLYKPDKQLWEGKFIMPAKGRISSPFGQPRILNGSFRYRHNGMDIATKKSPPILAANNGIVVLTDEFGVEGKTVLISHGQNVFTQYSHLKKIDVGLGQEVNKGYAVGYAGSTGFSTGEHLHWAVIVNSVFVDPLQWVAEEF